MLSVIVWQCECGCRVKALYYVAGVTFFRCPKRPCSKIHPIDGKIDKVWTEEPNLAWREVNARDFIVS